jgi:hypothetical protein
MGVTLAITEDELWYVLQPIQRGDNGGNLAEGQKTGNVRKAGGQNCNCLGYGLQGGKGEHRYCGAGAFAPVLESHVDAGDAAQLSESVVVDDTPPQPFLNRPSFCRLYVPGVGVVEIHRAAGLVDLGPGSRSAPASIIEMEIAVGICAIFFGRNRVTAVFSLDKRGLHVLQSIARLGPAVLMGVISFLLISNPALGTHQIDHRFTVWGEVLTSDGQPVSGETISFTVADDTPIGSIVTDNRGRYRVVLHVHDQDLGKVFDMTVRGIKTKVKIEFDPADKVTERGKRVDIAVEK